jgi:hypothetical protein
VKITNKTQPIVFRSAAEQKQTSNKPKNGDRKATTVEGGEMSPKTNKQKKKRGSARFRGAELR